MNCLSSSVFESSPRPLAFTGEGTHIVDQVPVASDKNLTKQKKFLLYFLKPLLTNSIHAGSPPMSGQSHRATSLVTSLDSRTYVAADACGSESTSSKEPVQGEPVRGGPPAFLQCKNSYHRVTSDDDSSINSSFSGLQSSTQGSERKFDLTPQQAAQWDQKLEELISFRDRSGHCVVPHKWPQNPTLATWVKRQRYQWVLLKHGKRSTLTQERKETLDALNFVWNSYDAAWEEKFMELLEYKRQFGHTNVSSTDNNHSLSVWVQCQRRKRKKMHAGICQMKQGRIDRLNAVGFVWYQRKQRK